MANGKIDKFMGKCNKQLQAVGSIKRKLTKTRSLSTSTDIVSGYDDPDLDHLLENTDQVNWNKIFGQTKNQPFIIFRLPNLE